MIGPVSMAQGMEQVRIFGRRAGQQSQAPQKTPPAAPRISTASETANRESAGRKWAQSRLVNSGPVSSEPVFPPADPSQLPDVDAELRQWKQARGKSFTIPWRPLSVMAGLCFGIASLVLPDDVSDIFQWVLYALAAASFYAGLRKRRDSGA